MLGAEHLFAYGQCALEEWPRRCIVALRLAHDGEVVEALCRKGMLGAEHLLTFCKDTTNNGRSLGVSCAAVQVGDRPVQEVGPVSNVRCGIGARFAQRKQMRRKLTAQRPQVRVFGGLVLGVDRPKPRNQSLFGVLRRAFCLRPCYCHCLHETMHRHRRRAVLERVVLRERDFGERGQRFHAFRFVLRQW